MSNPLHFTIGTGLSQHPTIEQLSLENDLSLVKVGLLYADHVRLCSIGSSLALHFAKLMGASPTEQLDWLEQYFVDLAPTNPEAAATVQEFVRLYHDLRRRRPGTLNKSQIQTKFEVHAGMRKAWTEFEEGIGEFLRVAGADGIGEALDTGLLDLHRFEAGGVERMGGLTPEDQDQRQGEFVDDLFWEFFDLISEAVADGRTNPLFDRMSGDLFRIGVEAGVVSPPESGVARGRHSGLASDLLQRLPLFEKATVQDILAIRRELEGPLVKFRSAVISASEDIRSAAWDTDFPYDADTAFRKAVEPAILEIEEAVCENGSLGELILRSVRPGDLATGFGVMLGSLAALPDVAALVLGSGTTAAMTSHAAYKEWREDHKNIESNQMYFYYRTREHLATLDEAPATRLPRRARQVMQTSVAEAGGVENASETQSDIERAAQEFMDENEPLLDEGGIATLQKVIIQGANIFTELSAEVVEAANRYTVATHALTEAIENPATRPRRVSELELERDRLQPVYERKNRIFEVFRAFIDRAKATYEEKGDETEQE